MTPNYMTEISNDLARAIKEYYELFKGGYLPAIETVLPEEFTETVTSITQTTKLLKENCEYAEKRREADVKRLLDLVKSLGL